MAAIEKYKNEIEKTKTKISELQKKVRDLEQKIAEEENLEIVRMVKAVKMDNRELTAYYRGLIALRKQIPALCDKSIRARERVLHASVPAPRCVTVELDNPEGPWKRILLIYNASSRAVSVPLPDGRWNLLADGEQSFWWRAPHPVKEAKAAPGTALILGLA